MTDPEIQITSEVSAAIATMVILPLVFFALIVGLLVWCCCCCCRRRDRGMKVVYVPSPVPSPAAPHQQHAYAPYQQQMQFVPNHPSSGYPQPQQSHPNP